MGTFLRSIAGLVVAGTTLGVLLAGGGQIYRALQDAAAAQSDLRTPRERMFAVHVATLAPETATPVITSYGRLYSWRTLELRSAVAGRLIALSDDFKDGGSIAEGELLFRIDPSRLETALALAESDLDEAEAELAEARAALELAKLEVAAATRQLELRQQALDRQESLRDRGAATEAAVETAVLALAAAEQTLIGRRQVLAQDEARVAQAAIAVDRRAVALGEARRTRDEATVTAPFAGVMSDVTAVLGRLVAVNEKLGALIDPAAMEIAFRVTNTQFARLLNDRGSLRNAEVTLILEQGRSRTELAAKIERAGAEVGEGQVGRLVYARLVEPDLARVRPGDFMTVEVSERPLQDVARIPAAAATPDGRILLVGEGDRLEEAQVTLLRQQGDTLIVGDAPFGRQYVLARAQQLGPGIRVTPVSPRPEGTAATDAPPPAPDTIALDDARRAKLIAFIEANETMQAASKERVLGELAKPEVPREIVERFEAKMGQ